MQEVRNIRGKLVCKVDPARHRVHVVHKGAETTIVFKPNGSMTISNRHPAS